MISKATTVADYLASLPLDRRAAVEAVRQVVLANVDKNVEERMSYGMIGYAIPHSVYPAGYHCDPKMPLPYAGLASQKGHMSLYLMAIYDAGGMSSNSVWFRSAWIKTGKKLDMGKSCIRFKKIEDLALDVIAEAIRRFPSSAYIKQYEAVLAQGAAAKRANKPMPKAKSTTKATKAGTAKKTAKKSVKKVAKKTAKKRAR